MGEKIASLQLSKLASTNWPFASHGHAFVTLSVTVQHGAPLGLYSTTSSSCPGRGHRPAMADGLDGPYTHVPAGTAAGPMKGDTG